MFAKKSLKIVLACRDLSNNELSWVLEDMANPFRGLSECQTLNLANNKIHSIHPQALNDLPNLAVLNFTSNPIKWLSERAFEDHPFVNLVLQDIDTLVCNCESSWLRSRLISFASKGKGRHRDSDRRSSKKSSNKVALAPLYCGFPPTLNKQNLLEVSPENLTCPGKRKCMPC